MDDFVMRFGEPDGNGGFVLSSSRQSIITSLLSAGTFVYAQPLQSVLQYTYLSIAALWHKHSPPTDMVVNCLSSSGRSSLRLAR